MHKYIIMQKATFSYKKCSFQRGGDEGDKTPLAIRVDADLMRKQARTELESSVMVTAIQIGRWTLNYKLEEIL